MSQKFKTEQSKDERASEILKGLENNKELTKLLVIYDRLSWSNSKENWDVMQSYAYQLAEDKDKQSIIKLIENLDKNKINNLKDILERKIKDQIASLLKNEEEKIIVTNLFMLDPMARYYFLSLGEPSLNEQNFIKDYRIFAKNKFLGILKEELKKAPTEEKKEIQKEIFDQTLAIKLLNDLKNQIDSNTIVPPFFNNSIRQIFSLLPKEIKNQKFGDDGQTIESALQSFMKKTDESYLNYSIRISSQASKFNELYASITKSLSEQVKTSPADIETTDKKPNTGPEKKEKPKTLSDEELRRDAAERVEYDIKVGAGKIREETDYTKKARKIIFSYFNQDGKIKADGNMQKALIEMFYWMGAPNARKLIAKIAQEAGEGKTPEQVLIEAINQFNKDYGKLIKNKQAQDAIEEVVGRLQKMGS